MLAAIVLGVTWVGGLPFRYLAAIIALMVFYEWMRMTRPETGSAWRDGGLGIVPAILMFCCAVVIVANPTGLLPLAIIVGLAIVVAVAATLRKSGMWDAAGLAYATLSGLALAALREGGHAGLVAILFLFAVVWVTDSAAYFVGRAVGGAKLAPSISPGKTRSGAIGGLAGGVVAGLLVAYFAGSGNLAALAVIALILSIVSQAGDLFESWIKRRHGKKDSGSIIPGHGGVMDRVDGLVAAAVALYLIGSLSGGMSAPANALFPA